jgi:hypothetical protein
MYLVMLKTRPTGISYMCSLTMSDVTFSSGRSLKFPRSVSNHNNHQDTPRTSEALLSKTRYDHAPRYLRPQEEVQELIMRAHQPQQFSSSQ